MKLTIANLKNKDSKRRLTEGGERIWLAGKEGLRKELLVRKRDKCL